MPSDQWTEIKDFSPGIFGDFHGGITNAAQGSIPQNGAATIQNTYRCCADQTGALVPLPGVRSPVTDSIVNSATPAYQPAAQPGWFLMDAHVSGPQSVSKATLDTAGTIGGLSGDGIVALNTLYMGYINAAGSGASAGYYAAWLGRQYRRPGQFVSGSTTSVDFLWDTMRTSGIYLTSSKFPADLYSGALAEHRSVSSTPYNYTVCYPTLVAAVNGQFTQTFSSFDSNDAPYTTFDTDITYLNGAGTGLPNYASYRNNFLNGYLSSYPDPTYPTAQSVQVYSASGYKPTNPILIVGHQDRIVSVQRTFWPSGGSYHIKDTLFYTGVRDFNDVGGSTSFQFDVGSENVTGIGLIASVNTDELLLIKHRDGGLLIRGDLDNPTIARLRSIESTYGVSASPVNTPIGLVYGTRNGVFVWAGGEQSKKLSTQIEGFFWNHTDNVVYQAHRGRFAFMHPWVAVPNNYLFDVRTNGWWRLTNPADRGNVAYNCYSIDPTNGFMYAFPHKRTATQTVVADVFSSSQLSDSYSWQSQPLVETIDRQQSYQELEIVASPGNQSGIACTINLTLTGYNEDGTSVDPVTTMFNFNGNGTSAPVILRKHLATNFVAQYVQVKIVASTTVSAPAPKIHAVRLGHADRRRNPVKN